MSSARCFRYQFACRCALYSAVAISASSTKLPKRGASRAAVSVQSRVPSSCDISCKTVALMRSEGVTGQSSAVAGHAVRRFISDPKNISVGEPGPKSSVNSLTLDTSHLSRAEQPWGDSRSDVAAGDERRQQKLGCVWRVSNERLLPSRSATPPAPSNRLVES